jgi:serine/threonine protein kinase
MAGKKVQCPNCKAVVVLPGTSTSVERQSQPAAGAPNYLATTDTACEAHTAGNDQQFVDFLAPAQGPDELGRLGPYRILRVLGSGGMGVVFLAEDPQLQRLVALKAMLPTLAASGTAKQRFLREARTAAALKHDHIVTIHQVGEDRGAPFLAMEFLDGESLSERLARERKLPLSEVLRIGREIADGLEAAHQRGLIHRDIKPANIWLEGGRGRVKILDFGLARAAAEEAHLTQPGMIVGTPAYMAPEQAQGERIDGRCDLFSLGCILYQMATGEPPFGGTDTISTLLAVATRQPRAAHELDPGLPRPLSELIARLLAKDPAGRPQSSKVVVEILRDVETQNAPSNARTENKWPEAKGASAITSRQNPTQQRDAATQPGSVSPPSIPATPFTQPTVLAPALHPGSAAPAQQALLQAGNGKRLWVLLAGGGALLGVVILAIVLWPKGGESDTSRVPQLLINEDFRAAYQKKLPVPEGWDGAAFRVIMDGDDTCLEVSKVTGRVTGSRESGHQQPSFVTLPPVELLGDFYIGGAYIMAGDVAPVSQKKGFHSLALRLENHQSDSLLLVAIEQLGNVTIGDDAYQAAHDYKPFLPTKFLVLRKGNRLSVLLNDQVVADRRIDESAGYDTVKLGLTPGGNKNQGKCRLYRLKVGTLGAEGSVGPASEPVPKAADGDAKKPAKRKK